MPGSAGIAEGAWGLTGACAVGPHAGTWPLSCGGMEAEMCFRPANLVLNKTCPECGEVSDATVTECPACVHDLLSVEPDMPDPNAPGVPGAEVFDPSDIGKPPTAPKAPGAPAAPKAPGAPAPKAPGAPGVPGVTNVPGVPK